MHTRHDIEAVLAAVTLVSTAILLAASPGSPFNFALVFGPPGALALVAVFGAFVDGFGPASLVIGALGALTLGLVIWSLPVLVTATGGVFFGGLFVLVAVLARALVGAVASGRPDDQPEG